MSYAAPWVKTREHFFSYKSQCVIRQWCDRYWMPLMSPAQHMVMTLVISRTMGWGKLWETIPMRHFVEGAARRDFKEGDSPVTRMHFRGTNLTEPTVRKAIQFLVEHGFLRRKPHRDTFRYSLAWQRMGTAADPSNGLMDEEADKAVLARSLFRLRQDQWRKTGQEPPQSDFPPNTQHHHPAKAGLNILPSEVYPAREEDPITSPADCQTVQTPAVSDTSASDGETSMTIKWSTPRKDRAARAAGPSCVEDTPEGSTGHERPSHAAPDLSAMRSRPRRVAGTVAVDEESQDVFRVMRDREVPAPTTQEHITSIERGIRDERERKDWTGKETLAKCQRIWLTAVTEATGRRVSTFSHVHVAKLKTILNTMELPEANMRWSEVMDWVARNYGEATALAVPFMLRNPEKRADILHSPPAITMFLAFFDHYAAAYVQSKTGEGFTREAYSYADAAEREHKLWMERKTIAGKHGSASIPRRLHTADELMEAAQAMADVDPEVRRALGRRQALQAAAAAARGNSGVYRQRNVDAAVRRERALMDVEEGRAEREALAAQTGIRYTSDDPDDYYNDGV